MTKQEMQAKVMQALAELGLGSDYGSDTKIWDTGADSLDTVEIAMFLEEELRLEIDDYDFEDLMAKDPTISDIAEYLLKLKGDVGK